MDEMPRLAGVPVGRVELGPKQAEAPSWSNAAKSASWARRGAGAQAEKADNVHQVVMKVENSTIAKTHLASIQTIFFVY